MLNTFTVVGHQEFFDLPGFFRGLFIQRNTNAAVGRGQCLG